MKSTCKPTTTNNHVRLSSVTSYCISLLSIIKAMFSIVELRKQKRNSLKLNDIN